VLPDPHGVIDLSNKVAELGDTVLTTKVENDTGHEYTTGNKKTRIGMRLLPYDSSSEIQYCDATAGKFTAIPRDVVEGIGLPDTTQFPHNFCDYDYTLRATEHGFRAGVYTEVSAQDTEYELRSPRLTPDISLLSVLKNTFSPDKQKGYNLHTTYRQCKRFCGPPSVMPYLVFMYYFIQSIAFIIAKVLFTVLKEDHQLR
jgi:hypothetical protein